MNRLLFLLLFVQFSFSQNYWQQHVDYKMDINMDVSDFTFNGEQELVYTNNSPDTINKVYYHLFFNAFQPGSEMAVQLRNSPDKNTRFKVNLDSISKEQEGFLKVVNLTQDGVLVNTIDAETILEVILDKPIAPGDSSVFELSFNGHVPDVIRRAGKNSSEGVAYSMAQWYPKMAEYDREGWNADPYIGREFHGVWGNFDVKITLDLSLIHI